jgi:hypothetical protein
MTSNQWDVVWTVGLAVLWFVTGVLAGRLTK